MCDTADIYSSSFTECRYFVRTVPTSAMLILAEEVCVFMLLILAVEPNKVRCGICQLEYTEDSKEDYTTDAILGKALRADKKCNVDWSRTYYTEDDGYITVDCGRCYIYNLQVSAKRDTRNDPVVCSGLTPELFTSKLDCAWKNTCLLRYSTATIVLSLPNQESNCVGEETGTVDVGYSCIDSDIQVDVVMKGFQAYDSQRGLVRSHNYIWGNRIAYPKYKDRFVMDISPSADIIISGKDYFMLFYVVTSNISAGDKLIIYNSYVTDCPLDTDECQLSAWEVDCIHNISSSTVRFEFLLNATSRPNLGFDICFQWFEVENVNANMVFGQTVEQCKQAMKTKNNAFPTFDMIKDTSTHRYKGFVKSHSMYPWNYPRYNGDFSFVNRWSSEAHVLQAPSNLGHLRLQVVELKLAPRDRLQIINGHNKVGGLNKTGIYEFQGQSVTFNFSVRHSSDKTEAGFLMCYQWYIPEQDSLATTTDLCSSFAYTVDPCGKKKQNKRLLKNKCGLWKTPKNGKKQQKPKKKHRNSKT